MKLHNCLFFQSIITFEIFKLKSFFLIVLLLGFLLPGMTNAQADLCTNAGLVTCGMSLTDQTNVGATNDAFPLCNTSGILSSGSPNVWYTFAGTGQTVTVSTCSNTGFDSEIAIFSGSCGSLVCVVGSDFDACASSDETVSFVSVAGTNYYIMIQGHFGATGTFTLDVTCVTPPADPCASPIETIACESSKSVTLSGSGDGWSPNSCGFTTSGAEKVFSFTPIVTGNHTLQVSATNSSFVDYFFKDASGGCSSTGWTCIDDVSTVSSVTFGPLTAGTTYFILLDDENTTASMHTFQINCPTPPIDPCITPIESIACESSKSVTLNGSGGDWSPNSCGFTTAGAEKVFSFTPTITGIHTLQVLATNGTYVDYFIKDASAGCSSSAWTCIDDVSVATSTTFGPLTAGTTYLILLDDENTSASIHNFKINCPNLPVVLTCPMNQTEAAGQTQLDINVAFANWLSTVSASGGCNGNLSNNNVGAPPATGGSTTVTFTYMSSCAPFTTTCQTTFSVEAGLYQNIQTGLSYSTLQAAIDAAVPGQTIILLDNVSESNVTVNNSVTIEANGFTLTIPTGTLTIPSGKSLTWKEDTLIIGPGASIDNDGTLKNNGTINYQSGTGTFNNTGAYSGIGSFEGNFVNNGEVSPGN